MLFKVRKVNLYSEKMMLSNILSFEVFLLILMSLDPKAAVMTSPSHNSGFSLEKIAADKGDGGTLDVSCQKSTDRNTQVVVHYASKYQEVSVKIFVFQVIAI
jgi:hypothetical protein